MGIAGTLIWAIPKYIAFNVISLIVTLMSLGVFVVLAAVIYVFERRFILTMIILIVAGWSASRNAINAQDDIASFASTFINTVYTPLIVEPINLILEIVQMPFRAINAWTLFWQTIWGLLFLEVDFDWWAWAASRELHASSVQARKSAHTLELLYDSINTMSRDDGFRVLTTNEVTLLKYKIEAHVRTLEHMGAYSGGISRTEDDRAIEDVLLSGVLIGENILIAVICIIQEFVFIFFRILLGFVGVALDFDQDWIEIILRGLFTAIFDAIPFKRCFDRFPYGIYSCLKSDLWPEANDVPSDLVRATVNLACVDFDSDFSDPFTTALDIGSDCLGVDILEGLKTAFDAVVNGINVAIAFIEAKFFELVSLLADIGGGILNELTGLLSIVEGVFSCLIDPKSCIEDCFGFCREMRYRKYYLDNGVLPDEFPMDAIANAGSRSPFAPHAAHFTNMTYGEARDFVFAKRTAHMQREEGAVVPRTEHPDYWEEILDSAVGNSSSNFHIFAVQIKVLQSVCAPNMIVNKTQPTVTYNGTEIVNFFESDVYYTCNETVFVIDAHGNNMTMHLAIQHTNFTRHAERVMEKVVVSAKRALSHFHTAIGHRLHDKQVDIATQERKDMNRRKYGPENNIIRHPTADETPGARDGPKYPGSRFYTASDTTIMGDLLQNVLQKGFARAMDEIHNTTEFTEAIRDPASRIDRCDVECKRDIAVTINGTGNILSVLTWVMQTSLTTSGYRSLTRAAIEDKLRGSVGKILPLVESIVRWGGRISAQGGDMEGKASRDTMRLRTLMARSTDAFQLGTEALRNQMFSVVDRNLYGNKTDAFIDNVFGTLIARVDATKPVPVLNEDDAMWRAGQLLDHAHSVARDAMFKRGTKVSNAAGLNGRALAAAAGFSLVLVGMSVFSFAAATSGALITTFTGFLVLIVTLVAPNILTTIVLVPRYAMTSFITAINGDDVIDTPDLLLPWFFAIQASVTDWFENGVNGFDFSVLETQIEANFDASLNLVAITFIRDVLSGGVLGQLFGIGRGGEPTFDPTTGRVTDTPATYFARWGQCDPTISCSISDPISRCYGSIDPTDDDEWRDRICTVDNPCSDGVSGVYGKRLCPGYFRTGFHFFDTSSTIMIAPDCNAAFGYKFKSGSLSTFGDYLDEVIDTTIPNGLRSLQVGMRKIARGDRASPLFLVGGLLIFVPFVGSIGSAMVTVTIVTNVLGYFVPEIAETVITQLEQASTVTAYQSSANYLLLFFRSPNHADPGKGPFGEPTASEQLCAVYAAPQAGVLILLFSLIFPLVLATLFTGLPISILYWVLFNIIFFFDIIFSIVASFVRGRTQDRRLREIKARNEKVQHSREALEVVTQINNDMLSLTKAVEAGSQQALATYNDLDLLRDRAMQMASVGRKMTVAPSRRSALGHAITRANRRYRDNILSLQISLDR